MAIATEDERLRGCVQQLQRGDETALASIWESQGAHFVSIIHHRNGGDYNGAEEGANDVLLKAWRFRDRIDLERHPNPKHWFNEVANNIGIDQFRRNQARPKAFEPLPWSDAERGVSDIMTGKDSDPEEEFERSEEIQGVREALGKLPPSQREAVVLAYYEGLTHPEVANRVGIPLGTAKSRIRSGMEKLRTLLLIEPKQIEDIEVKVFARENEQAAQESLILLSPDQRVVMELSYYAGFTHEQIANFIKKSSEKVKEDYSLGLRKLNSLINDPQRGTRSANQRINSLLTNTSRVLLRRAIAFIPEEEAGVLTLRFLGGHTTPEIARVMRLHHNQRNRVRRKVEKGIGSLKKIAGGAEVVSEIGDKIKAIKNSGERFPVTDMKVSLLNNFGLEGETYRDFLDRVIKQNGSVYGAAKFLGVSSQALFREIANLSIEINTKRGPHKGGA